MRKLIHSSLDVAWRTLGNLKTPATLVKKDINEFDFGNSEVDENSPKSLKINIVVLKTSFYNEIHTKKVLLKQRGLGSIDGYDKMLFENEEWSVSPIIKGDDGYTKYLRLTRRGL